MNKNKIILIGTSPIVGFHVKALKESGLEPIAIASSNRNSSSQEKFAVEKNIKKLLKNSHEMIMVGYNRRFYKTVNAVKNFVLEEKNAVLASMVAPESSNIRNFFSNTSHSLDMLRYIFGEIRLMYIKKFIVNDIQKGLVATFSNDRKDVIQFIGNWGA